MAAKKIYLVETGPDQIKSFDNWPQCQKFVHGKPYPFGSGTTHEEAMAKLERSRNYKGNYDSAAPRGKKKAPVAAGPLPTVGITSDCGTHGNPGPCEYQVTDLKGRRLLHKHLGVHTNNYAELSGIEAMIDYAIEHGETKLWTDSQIAIGWIASGRLGPTVREPDLIMAIINRVRAKLKAHPELELLKWHTKGWGQIPSDFGRK